MRKTTCPGRFYEATVPDTLELVDRAKIGLNGIGGTIDPDLHHELFFHVYYAWKKPFMRHYAMCGTDDAKSAESFPLMRVMCGSDRYADVEATQNATLISRIQDGLYWDLYDPQQPWQFRYNLNSEFDGDIRNEDVSQPHGNARMLRTMLTWREFDNDTQWDTYIRDLVRGMRRIAIDHEDYCYYPDGGFGQAFNYPRSGWLRTDEPESETEGGEGTVVGFHGAAIEGLSRWYSVSGERRALDLAERLARFCMLPKFWGGIPDPNRLSAGHKHVPERLPDPVGIAGHELGHWYSFFHSRAIALRGLLAYASVAGDERALEFVRRAYEYTWSFSIARIGWINNFPGAWNLCEGCSLGDIVALGIRLTDSGAGDYWDDVDAVVRNHLTEQQIISADLLKTVSSASSVRPAEEYSPYPKQECEEHVIERSLGCYGCHSTPVSIPKPWVSQCCTANGTQGLYYCWEGAVREDNGTATVNLLLNRTAKYLDVDSYLPYEGKVTIHNKSAARAYVRMPAWVTRRDILCDVSGRRRAPTWMTNYLRFDDLKPGDEIHIEFPIKETTARYTACSGTNTEEAYTCTFRGSTLVDISPRDDSPASYPLYLREHMRKDTTPMRKRMRFLPEKTILKW